MYSVWNVAPISMSILKEEEQDAFVYGKVYSKEFNNNSKGYAKYDKNETIKLNIITESDDSSK